MADTAVAGERVGLLPAWTARIVAAVSDRLAAEGERVIVMHLAPFFNAQTFAGQFGTQEARDHILQGLTKAGFR